MKKSPPVVKTSPTHGSNLTPPHAQLTVTNDQCYSSNEREEGVNGTQDNLNSESGSLIFKKVNIQRPNRGEGRGEGDKNSSTYPQPYTRFSSPVPVPRTDSLLSTNSGGNTTTGEKRKVSFNDDIQVEQEGGGANNGEGAGPAGGAGLRRLLYRHRNTISKMLHDGENHEVWRPGMRRERKADSQVIIIITLILWEKERERERERERENYKF